MTVPAYYPALQNKFVNWDDYKNIVENPHYRGLGWAHIRWMSDHVAEWTLKAGQVSALRKPHSDSRITGDPVLRTLLAQAGQWQSGQATPKWVAAENVTIDLNGFSIIGPVVCNGSGAPVTSCSPAATVGRVAGVDGGINSNVTVVNGTVRGMGMFGIALGRNSLVEKVHVESNGSIGILAFGSTVSGNTVGRNFGAGISCDSCTVSGNTVRDNGFQGILASGTVSGNTVVENGNDGINAQGTVSGNTSFTNSGRGIIAFCPSSVVGNTAAFNIQTNLVTSGPGCAAANNAAP